MNTLVMNLQNLAVTEHTAARTGMSGALDTSDSGVYLTGGTADDGGRIYTTFSLGTPLNGDSTRQRARRLYLYGSGLSTAIAHVSDSKGASYQYAGGTHDRATRFLLGRGLRDNYLAVKVSQLSAAATVIDRLEFEADTAASRRM